MAKTVLLCTGKSCRKKAKVQAEILANLDEDIVIQPVRCQDVCSGPVIGLKVRGRWEWFKKLRKAKDAHAAPHPPPPQQQNESETPYRIEIVLRERILDNRC